MVEELVRVGVLLCLRASVVIHEIAAPVNQAGGLSPSSTC